MTNEDQLIIDDQANGTAKDATEFIGECYVDLSKYTTRTRAYAGATDGLKTVYRRIIYAARGYNKLVKSAAIVGDAIKFHPHGDSSIYGALVEMACEFGQFPLFNKKGNFGGKGHGAASMRYTEAYLSDVAKLMYLELIDYAEMIEGEAGYSEPKYLPALIPYCLLVGTTSIPVGMPVPSIPSYDVMDLINYYLDRLNKVDNPKLPMVDFGEIVVDCDREHNIDPMTNNGQGKLWFQGIIYQEDWNKFVVKSETPSCNFWKLYSKLEGWIDAEEIDYIDESSIEGDRHVFIASNPSKVSPDQLKDRIKKAMKCSNSYNFILEDNDRAVYCGLDYIYRKSIKYLRECTIRKFSDKRDKSQSRLIILQAITDLKNSGKLNDMPSMSSDEVKNLVVELGYEDWVGKAVLDKPMRYLTKSHDSEINELKSEVESHQNYVDNPDDYLITLYTRLRDMVSPFYRSRGHSITIEQLHELDKPKYARLNGRSHVEFISRHTKGTTGWNNSLIFIQSSGFIYSKVTSRLIDSMELDEGYHADAIAGDQGKYLVLILADRHIYVEETSKILDYAKDRFKSWDGMEINYAFSTNSEDVKFTDDKGTEVTAHLSDWIKTRISNPARITTSKVVKYEEC